MLTDVHKYFLSNQPGYIAKDGTIFLGFCGNKPEEFVYAMPKDVGSSTQTIQDALQWVQNANNSFAYSHDDWDLPNGATQCKNELYLMYKAAHSMNDILNFNTCTESEYGGKSIQSYTIGGHKNYEDIFIWLGENYSFNEKNKVNFRAVRRTTKLVI